ncbi:hypothetical protein HRI_002351800 [Hibiscus trionum]|uniref:Tf2-1-like SH3-like domain-containing protein n=1 Tax=Hibiscus trionum TaxID=183268 RepID=A0A9W7M5V9_HIBTR|nr:hypothetical protein HRI_002351800 [Hibiscus trionum]
MTGEKPREWGEWLHLAEWWYNTSYHVSIQTTPYQALYGQEPPVHVPYMVGESLVAFVDRSLQQREAALAMLKFYLKRAQNRMKQQVDRLRTDCDFQEGDLVYLKLQPYRQHSVQRRISHKLSPKWFGLFKVISKVGAVAYKLQLPDGSRIHHVFHVSQLKKHVGEAVCSNELPLVGPDGSICKEPVRILDRRIGKRGGRAVTEVLMEWTNSFPEDSTWEALYQLQQQFPQFNP